MEPLFAPIFDVLTAFAVLGGGALLVAGGVVVAPRVLGLFRQRAYDRAAAAELACWSLRLDPDDAREPDLTRRLVAALHPGERRGTSGWAAGWPQLSLVVRWSDGRASWLIEAPRQLRRVVEAAVSAAYPTAELEEVVSDPPSPAEALTLGLSGAPPPDDDHRGADLGARLVELFARLPRGAHATWTLRVRPRDPRSAGADADGRPSFWETFLDAALNRPSRPSSSWQRPARLVGPGADFTVSAQLSAWASSSSSTRAWLFDAASLAGSLRAGGWTAQARVGGRPGPMALSAAALAVLWGLDGAGLASRPVEIVRSRRLSAPGAALATAETGQRPIGRDGERLVGVPAELFLRHAAFIGRTGSGKSTELVALAADDLRAGRGFTFIDPHGDAIARLLDAVPASQVERVHLLELGERSRPRAFNPIELDGADPELVAGQFVDTLADLYPRYSGPKQTHYLRNALLTVLIQTVDAERPATPLDLYDLLVDPERRRDLIAGLNDPHLATFWKHEWPITNRSAREPSVEAVINKLGGFLSYPSIRQIVASPHSSIRPRRIMDDGHVLLVDLSRVARDHGRLFGSLLIARYAIDALARQGTPAATRRPHQLYVDEVHAFDTSSLRAILTETRKFGLGTTVATQYLDRLGDELRTALLSDVGTLALLQPAADDARLLARSFEPLSERDLLGLPRFRMAIRTELAGQRAVFTVEVLPEPPQLESADAVRRLSDERDGHDPL